MIKKSTLLRHLKITSYFKKHHKRTFVALLLFIGFAVFFQTLFFEFLGGDDSINVYRNFNINPPHISNLITIWGSLYEFLYIPVTYTVWLITAFFATDSDLKFSLSPSPFHFINLSFHLLNGSLVFSIICQLFTLTSKKRVPNLKFTQSAAAFFGAILFLVHPAQVASVVWITGLKDVLFSFFALLAINRYLQFRTYNLSQHKYLTIAFFFLALLSKPTAVVLPILLVIIEIVFLKMNVKSALKQPGLWILIAFPIILLTKFSQPDHLIEYIPTYFERFLIAGDCLSFYFAKLVFPFSDLIGGLPGPPKLIPTLLESGWLYLSWIPPITLIAVLWSQRSRNPWLWGSILIFVFSLLPVLGFIPFKFQNTQSVAERYLYLPLFGASVGLSFFLMESKKRILSFSIIGIFLLAFMGLTLYQLPGYESDFKKMQFDLNTKSKDATVEYYRNQYNDSDSPDRNPLDYGWALSNADRVPEAIHLYQDALKQNPNHPMAVGIYLNLGTALYTQGKLVEALHHYKKAVELRPNLKPGLYNIGLVLKKQGKLEEAQKYFKKAERLR